jgi:hypothetical protein
MSEEHLEIVDSDGNVLRVILNVKSFITFISTICLLLIAQDAFAHRYMSYISVPFYYRIFCSTITIAPVALLLWLLPLSLLKFYSKIKFLFVILTFIMASIALGFFDVRAWDTFMLEDFFGPLIVLLFVLVLYFIMRKSKKVGQNKMAFTIIVGLFTLVSILMAASDSLNDELANPAQNASLILPLIAPVSMFVFSDTARRNKILWVAISLGIYFISVIGFYISLNAVQDVGMSLGLPTTW